MVEITKKLIIKYKALIMFGIFGVLTTIVNVLVYQLCYAVLEISNALSTIIAWLLAVAFAFITNKKWVFGSEKIDKKTLVREISSFILCRVGTGVLDLGIMIYTVDYLGWNALLMKLFANVLVIILNFVCSKLIIFK